MVTEKVTLKQRLEGGDRVSHSYIKGRTKNKTRHNNSKWEWACLVWKRELSRGTEGGLL